MQSINNTINNFDKTCHLQTRITNIVLKSIKIVYILPRMLTIIYCVLYVRFVNYNP